MFTCANCTIHACKRAEHENMPLNCPMRRQEIMEEAMAEYALEENRDFYITASGLERDGYCRWPRLRETMEFCRRMGYERVGLAFCTGLGREALTVERLLRQAGFAVESVICKCGGVDKTAAGIAEDMKLHPGGFEAMCNPIAQAKLLNAAGTGLNIALGLCVGHDSLFYKYSHAPVTTLVAKDRVTGHNPAAAIYCAEGYFKDRLNCEKP